MREAVCKQIRATHEAANGLTEAVEKNLEALKEPSTLAIVTGQQVGILGGPLYTIYKALHTVKLARQYASAFPGHTFVPVFWQETEDHDFPEVSGITLPTKTGAAVHLSYSPAVTPDRHQVAAIRFEEDALANFFSEISSTLIETEFSASVLDFYKECYKAGASFAEAQTAIFCKLLGHDGLLILNGNTRSLKTFVAPLFEKELRTSDELSNRLHSYSEKLAEHYFAQIDAAGTNLFLTKGDKRFKIVKDESRFTADGEHFDLDGILSIVKNEPERFSMNVVMRPLVQDTLLPTVAYVAGPGETAYFAQLSEAYRWAEMQMPVIVPRITLTITDERQSSLLEKYQSSLEALLEFGPNLIRELLRTEREEELAAAFDRSAQEMEVSIENLRNLVESGDATLGGALTSLKGKLLSQVKEFSAKTQAAERKKQQTAKQQLEKVLAVLLPENKLQERELNLIYFLNKYGLSFWEQLKTYLMETDLPLTEHHLIPVSSFQMAAEEAK